MNYTSRSPYQTISDNNPSFSNYRKISNTKLFSEKKALQNSYNTVMNSLNRNLSYGSPNIVCLKSAPIDSDSDDFLDKIVLPSHFKPSPKKSYSTPKNTNQQQSSSQQVMKYFNEFNDSLQDLQNEISEIRSMINPNFSSSAVK